MLLGSWSTWSLLTKSSLPFAVFWFNLQWLQIQIDNLVLDCHVKLRFIRMQSMWSWKHVETRSADGMWYDEWVIRIHQCFIKPCCIHWDRTDAPYSNYDIYCAFIQLKLHRSTALSTNYGKNVVRSKSCLRSDDRRLSRLVHICICLYKDSKGWQNWWQRSADRSELSSLCMLI